MLSQAPSLMEEKTLWSSGARAVAGVDEAGRGPLAGPVVAAAVVLPVEKSLEWFRMVRDSKLLTTQRRERLFECICGDSLSWGVGVVDVEAIDSMGIADATRLAMRWAVEKLAMRPDFLLIDHIRLPGLPFRQKSITRGDNLCLSIAAASVLAKVARDRLMTELDERYPGYGLARNKGYGTPDHLDGLRRLGPSPVHRRTFFPVREQVERRLMP
jgi:ribonuclease HII